MTKLSMKHLRYFEALARIGHFGRAAEDRMVSQPALSLQIKELETLIGAPLVERGSRGIRLTRLGEEFARRAREILQAARDLEEIGRAARGRLISPLRIGVIPTIAPYLLPETVQELSRRHPDLEIRPREAVTHKLIADLLKAQLDLVVAALPISEPLLAETELFTEEFVLVRPLKDAGEPPPDPQTLREMRLLLLEEGHCFRDQALSFCGLSSSPPRDLMEGSSLSTLVRMVGAGIGVTLIPEIAASVETRAAAVSLTRLPPPRPLRRIGMLWRKSDPLVEHFAQVAEVVRQIGARSAARAFPGSGAIQE
ncbi:hydrogen peroxide-inducible genes activator [Neomegalonema sp.]|uniref:hydrogen peroxide-inducible genes activator n=1 Tax=Neomegalonema sp. TaxID=2039713 RepID=UPI0026292F77|nr:hydrogen peroxide-inducible genes activator [Neomegalonema sp.]MDD2869969.1 LysR substrate-binding domain-containing protein [Neomegalonema sp.]